MINGCITLLINKYRKGSSLSSGNGKFHLHDDDIENAYQNQRWDSHQNFRWKIGWKICAVRLWDVMRTLTHLHRGENGFLETLHSPKKPNMDRKNVKTMGFGRWISTINYLHGCFLGVQVRFRWLYFLSPHLIFWNDHVLAVTSLMPTFAWHVLTQRHRSLACPQVERWLEPGRKRIIPHPMS